MTYKSCNPSGSFIQLAEVLHPVTNRQEAILQNVSFPSLRKAWSNVDFSSHNCRSKFVYGCTLVLEHCEDTVDLLSDGGDLFLMTPAVRFLLYFLLLGHISYRHYVISVWGSRFRKTY